MQRANARAFRNADSAIDVRANVHWAGGSVGLEHIIDAVPELVKLSTGGVGGGGVDGDHVEADSLLSN